MKILLDIKKCVGCGACLQICKHDAIQMIKNSEGFLYPLVNESKCLNCKECQRVCPAANDLSMTEDFGKRVICAKNKSDSVRYNSSSGGVFFSLAKKVLEQRGVVFGVAMSNDIRSAHHIYIEDVKDINKLLGSKYIQSVVGNIYIEVKKFLDEGRQVLFSGTPCQVKALRLFLKKDYDNLLCVDLICHGVPSQVLWEKNINYIENKLKKRVVEVNFRSKLYGWKNFGQSYNFQKDHYKFQYNFEDPYFLMFNSNICLRESCYVCESKHGKSGADITLGDFWNVERIFPGFDDNKGLSMIIVNNYKGEKTFSEIKQSILLTENECTYEDAKECNSAIYKSMTRPSTREEFYIDVKNMDFEQLKKKYVNINYKVKLKTILGRIGVLEKIDKIRVCGGNS